MKWNLEVDGDMTIRTSGGTIEIVEYRNGSLNINQPSEPTFIEYPKYSDYVHNPPIGEVVMLAHNLDAFPEELSIEVAVVHKHYGREYESRILNKNSYKVIGTMDNPKPWIHDTWIYS